MSMQMAKRVSKSQPTRLYRAPNDHIAVGHKLHIFWDDRTCWSEITGRTPLASGRPMSATCHSFECSPPNLQWLVSLTPRVKSRSDAIGADRTHAARVRSVHHRAPPTSNRTRRCSRRSSIKLIPVSSLRWFFATGCVRSNLTGRGTEFGHHLAVKSVTSALASAYVSTTGHTSIEFGHNLPLVSGHMAEAAPSLEHTTGRAGLAEACVRSLFHSDKHLIHFINLFTLAQMCQPPSASPCARVLAYFHKHFQGC
jgi:hypothetical protein